jgi:hypothetical protein
LGKWTFNLPMNFASATDVIACSGERTPLACNVRRLAERNNISASRRNEHASRVRSPDLLARHTQRKVIAYA